MPQDISNSPGLKTWLVQTLPGTAVCLPSNKKMESEYATRLFNSFQDEYFNTGKRVEVIVYLWD
jgi:hypothetical protein